MKWCALFTLCAAGFAQTPAWVTRSNQNAQILIDIQARNAPESAGSSGVTGLDDQVFLPTADYRQRVRGEYRAALQELRTRFAAEQDPLVKQDLQILIDEADRSVRVSEAGERLQLFYFNPTAQIYSGISNLLQEQMAPERRPAALVRLRKYVGMEPGYTPTTELAEQRFREGLAHPELIGPSRQQVEKDLANSEAYVTGIGLLLEKYNLPGYQEVYAKLKQQVAAHDEFVRKEVLPHARTDFRMPPELYRLSLENFGIDYTPEELARLAHQRFGEIQKQLQTLAAKIAREKHLKANGYREVIRTLKKDQLAPVDILPHYEARLKDIEAILRREHLITLPERPAIIHLATAAETAQQPAPHMRPPPLLNNHGERGQFVLPMGTTGEGGKSLKYDDFTFAAASWTLTSHEARPGHELQFDAMVERGVSLARAMFAFNSTNVEGWGLYSEWFMLPYMPEDGQLISLQFQLLRAARAFLDPELQAGKVTPQQAMRILQEDVVCSEAFATEEVDRFTFGSPGQAGSYFDGYTRLRALRADVEKALGAKFNVQRFHDFVLSQGLLPPNLLRKVVMEEFVPQVKGA
ncbi:MAG TPA: DUF885 domain-containing protein [Bryobacteraceae bacterium]|jgi:uncharacterized protein (DUF885 family)